MSVGKLFVIVTLRSPSYSVIVSKYSDASKNVVSLLITFGRAGISSVLPFGKSIVPNGI